jgi:hypothetical protein
LQVSRFANDLFLDVIEGPAVILQENGEILARVIDLVDEDLPHPERDKVYIAHFLQQSV